WSFLDCGLDIWCLPPAHRAVTLALHERCHAYSVRHRARRPQAAEDLLPLVYDELRKLAAERLVQEKPGQTLDATALVHEAYLRLVAGGDGPSAKDKHW